VGKSLNYLRDLIAPVALSEDARERFAAFFEKPPAEGRWGLPFACRQKR
jgi:hypothetical protein